MKGTVRSATWVAALAAGLMILAGGPASGELTVTLTISGDIHEIIQVLEQLEAMGVGAGAEEDDDDFLKMHIHSVMPRELDESPLDLFREPAPPAPEPTPDLALLHPAVEPANVKPGGSVLITVRVADRDHKVDTLVATQGDPGDLGFDLYDNGTNGDVKAGDGVWSCRFPVPARVSRGTHTITVAAYDTHGNLVLTQDKEPGKPRPLIAKTRLTVEP